MTYTVRLLSEIWEKFLWNSLTIFNISAIYYIMRWENESLRPIIIPFLNVKEIIYDAYYEGFINWNVYQKALARIESNKNGSWMFVQGDKTKLKNHSSLL